MHRLQISDNCYAGKLLHDCIESENKESEAIKVITNDISRFSGKRFDTLVNDNRNLLVFPQTLDAFEDEIDQLQICSYDDQTHCLHTGNMMGFIGAGQTQLRISSRFDENQNDYFLHYMLQKVFCPHIIDFKHSSTQEKVFDFLLYLFPYYLNQALKQGLYKEYQGFEYNDCKVKGAIDISRHLNLNTPFSGRIAYKTREYSYDNRITQLIRHTIEYIEKSYLGMSIIQSKETDNNVRLIINSTPTYSAWNRRRVLKDNTKRLNHPYFTKYAVLQQLCIKILRHEEIKFGNDKDEVYGILFDGAWLWEEYLNTILQKDKFIHPRNKAKIKEARNPIYLFEDNFYDRYPDFYKEGEMIIDAKYKHLGGKIERNDLHQIISYLHVKNVPITALAYPTNNGISEYTQVGKLNGLGGYVGLLSLQIPTGYNSFNDFVLDIKKQESIFSDNLVRLSHNQEK